MPRHRGRRGRRAADVRTLTRHTYTHGTHTSDTRAVGSSPAQLTKPPVPPLPTDSTHTGAAPSPMARHRGGGHHETDRGYRRAGQPTDSAETDRTDSGADRVQTNTAGTRISRSVGREGKGRSRANKLGPILLDRQRHQLLQD